MRQRGGWGGAPGHTYGSTRQPNGTTDNDPVVVRDGQSLKDGVLGFVIGARDLAAQPLDRVASHGACRGRSWSSRFAFRFEAPRK